MATTAAPAPAPGLQLVVSAPAPVTVTAPALADLIENYTADIQPIAAFRVTDAQSFIDANLNWTKAKNFKDKVESLFADSKKKAFAAHKAITSLEGQFLAPAKLILEHMDKEIGRYRDEQNRLRRLAEEAEQRRREEAARAKMAEDARLAELERQAQMAELAAKADDLAPWEEEEALEAIAALAVQPPHATVIVEPVRFLSTVPQIFGGPSVGLKPWAAEVFDADAFWDAAYKDRALREYFVFDMPKLNAKAKELGADMERVISGVRAVRGERLRKA